MKLFVIFLLLTGAIAFVRARDSHKKLSFRKWLTVLLTSAALTFVICVVVPLGMVVFIGLAHIAAYSPDESDFNAIFTRDAQTYFTDRKGRPVTVRYEQLRDGPTQSGVGFPKYYLWVKVFSDDTLLDEGAVRVAGVAKDRFEITDFLDTTQIRNHPGFLDPVFPQSVRDTIRSRLRL